MAFKNRIGAAFHQRLPVAVGAIAQCYDRNARGIEAVPDTADESGRRVRTRFEVHDHEVGPGRAALIEKPCKGPLGAPRVADPGELGEMRRLANGPAHQPRGMNMVVDEHEERLVR